MLNFAGFQDALNAILVIIIVSVIIAVAWLSTNVREQPLIATAVVVFQSGVNGEGDRNLSVNDSSQLDGQSGGTREGGEVESVQPIASVKENESSAVMEMRPKTEEVTAECRSAEVMSVEPKLSEQNNETVSEKEFDVGAEATVLDKDAMQCCSQESSTDDGKRAGNSAELRNPSYTSSPSSAEKVHDDASQEMEVRNRRLKHFVTMGGSQTTQTHHEACSTSQDSKDPPPFPPKDGGSILEKSGGPSGEAQSSSTLLPTNDGEERPPGSIRIRLKFLDESQKYVFAQLAEQVGSFKRQHFSIEMDANRRIRLIFNGQLLSQDTSTLAHYGLFDNCVVHCHVSQPQQIGQNSSQGRESTAQDDEDAYVTSLLAPLLYCVMVVMWYLRYEYSHLFNTMSTVILLFLTALLLISTYLLYITQNVPGSDSAAQISSHHQLDTNSLL